MDDMRGKLEECVCIGEQGALKPRDVSAQSRRARRNRETHQLDRYPRPASRLHLLERCSTSALVLEIRRDVEAVDRLFDSAFVWRGAYVRDGGIDGVGR